MRRSGACVEIAFALVLAVLSASSARAAAWWELNFWLSGPRYDGVLPPCDTQSALERISSRFSQKESHFWNSKLKIIGFEDVRETAFRSWAPNTIPRRFCSAVALVSDGLKRPVHYWIAENSGIIGESWSVDWCVVGLDRNWSYAPGCRMAQP